MGMSVLGRYNMTIEDAEDQHHPGEAALAQRAARRAADALIRRGNAFEEQDGACRRARASGCRAWAALAGS